MAHVGRNAPHLTLPDERASLLPGWDLDEGDQCAIFDLAHERYDDVIVEHAAHLHAHATHSEYVRRQHRASEEQHEDYLRRLREQNARRRRVG